MQVNQVLNKCRDDAGKAAYMSVDLSNNIIKMVTAGSKVRDSIVYQCLILYRSETSRWSRRDPRWGVWSAA